MIVQAKTPDIVGVAVSPAALTCAWVRTGDGALVMRWTAQTTADAYEEITKTAA
jgi:hypothetical protein